MSVVKNQETATKRSEKKKSPFREWIDSIVFAVVAATLIRWLFMEAFTIPTPSMEKSLLVGDFLFVSKLHYGTRTPKTPLQVPLTHQKIWGTEIPSYLDWIQLPQFRLPGFSSVKQGDVVVFNYPPEEYPTDLKTNYIKRCIAVGGDVLEVRDRKVFVNGQVFPDPVKSETEYFLKTNSVISAKVFKRYDITDFEQSTETYGDTIAANDASGYRIHTTPETAALLKQQDFVQGIDAISSAKGMVNPFQPVYPQSSLFPWNVDNYGPITVPKEGATIQLDEKNIALYGPVIQKYEDNEKVELDGKSVKIDGKVITSYTFKQNYYFMMGDNRHNSADSRYWGFVPADHIVGKAVFIWMSIDPNPESVLKKIRWNRLFRIIE
ncbi:signal peptidase I [Larkinella rosea]|uniref:Signal peptidase I n=1 Tax=Larkinella rosea TaxID=2025312 RepID=A0A3P1C0C0_9BACT|nr:signal peptidase I [Larkinella rosea]RRB06787.1 signal peptidase I [Larkinella rosea]